MKNGFSNDYQYDSCVSRGICTLSPKVSAMQTVLILYFRIFAKFAINLYEKNLLEDRMKEFVLNSLAATIYNIELNEETYNSIIKVFQEKLPELIIKYGEIFPDENQDEELKNAKELFNETSNILKAIQYGEKRILKSQNELPDKIRDLYNIILIVIKSITINLLDFESYRQNFSQGFITILNLLNKLNLNNFNDKELKKDIFNAVNIDKNLMLELKKIQEKRYGDQTISEVSYSTEKGKAILVVGSNIKELENILENIKDTDINVYTHDEMMLAHTFPKFKEYQNLKGQYGQGIENCLLDFSTFPGPIILTRHSLHNIENFYRGRLFTTDYTCPKGVIRIQNQDYTEVINSANNSKGFKNGKICETVEIGFDYKSVINKIEEKINENNYKNIVIIGLDNYSMEQKNYFYKLAKNLPNNSLILSFSYDFKQENLIYINACYDSFSILKFYEEISKLNLSISVFIPKCDRHSISQMIYFANNEKTKVFVGKCFPLIINPSLLQTLEKSFSICSTTTVKEDINKILDNI